MQSPQCKKDIFSGRDVWDVWDVWGLGPDFRYAWDFVRRAAVEGSHAIRKYTQVRRAFNIIPSSNGTALQVYEPAPAPAARPSTSPQATANANANMTYQAPFYAFPPVAPPVLPQAFPMVSTIQSQDGQCDAGVQAAASWEQSIPFATHPLSFSPPNNMTYQQSDVDSTDLWGPIPSPPISASAIVPNSNASWTGQDEPSEDEIPMQSIARCRSGYQCQVPVGDTARPCGHVFSRRDRALTHVRVHFGMRPYTCQGACGVRGW